MTSRFMKARYDRVVDADFAGDVYVWDIDKTYLDTRFSSLRGLLAIPFELAVDKNNVAGTVPVLRALRAGPDPKEPRFAPLYFVSGSPPHLRDVVEKKMILDGVQFDGITFKDQLGLLLSGRPSAITEQVGYKLNALLTLRRQLPPPRPAGEPTVRFSLFGDDVEKDIRSSASTSTASRVACSSSATSTPASSSAAPSCRPRWCCARPARSTAMRRGGCATIC